MGSLLQLFCRVIGVDPARLTVPARPLNRSLTLAQAETLRRVNLALGDRLPAESGAYNTVVRQWVTREGLARQRGEDSLALPAGAVDWCEAESRRQVEELRALGVDLVGEVDDLLTLATAPARPASTEDTRVAEIAVRTIAELADHRWRELLAEPEGARPG